MSNAAKWMSILTVVFGCGGTAAPHPAVGPANPTAQPPAPAEPKEWPALRSEAAASDAPAGLNQFGRLAGTWACTTEQRQPDGTWKAGPGTATWTWFYTLGGLAVQDIWEPVTGAVGTNLRVYDAAEDAWQIQWVTGALTKFQHITAKADGENIVMHSDAPAAGPIPAHASRTTFFDIAADKFEWKYEATKLGTDTNWTEFSRLHCSKRRTR